MKEETYFLLKSNHGNHTGLNRKWTVIEANENKDILLSSLSQIALNSSDNYNLNDDGDIEDCNNNVQYYAKSESFEHDLNYYTIETAETAEKFELDNGHYAGLYNAIQDYINS